MGGKETGSTVSISVTMLGGFSIQTDRGRLTDEINRSQKLWSVLSYLLVHRDRSVPQSELIELFWTEDNSTNPVNALKTLLYRVRALLEPLFPEIPPILSTRGAYVWNPAIRCQTDADAFEALCAQARESDRPPESRLACYRQAMELYRGEYLPKLSSQLWVVPLSAHYHALFGQAVKDCAGLLEQAQRFDQMERLCRRAVQLDPLDEGLYTLLIRSLLRQGKEAAALEQYETATDLLYRSLGVRPSEELRALYLEIMAVEKSLETDLEVIQEGLRETARRPGAFVCEYGFFREAYRLEARRAARSGTCVHVALITLSLPQGGLPPLEALNQAMDQLRAVLVHNLRRGDVVSRYSAAQYVLMLPAANFEDSTMVLERIASAFSRQRRHSILKLSYRVRALELEQDPPLATKL